MQEFRYAADFWPRYPDAFKLAGRCHHAKQNYGAEPDLFSFNEANIGVYVLFTPEEHKEALKSIGAHLKKLGLKPESVATQVVHRDRLVIL